MDTSRVQLKLGLLTIRVSRYDALSLIDAMMAKTRVISRIEIGVSEGDSKNTYVTKCLSHMARYTRMCYELYESNILTNLSKEDVEALYDLPLTGTGNLHNVLNEYRYAVSPSGIDDIAEGHVMAKSIRTILEG